MLQNHLEKFITMNQLALLAATSLFGFIPQAHAAHYDGRASDIIQIPPSHYVETLDIYEMKDPKKGYSLSELKNKITSLIDLESHYVGEKKDNYVTNNSIIWRNGKAEEASEALKNYFHQMPGYKKLYSQKKSFDKKEISLKFQIGKNDISTIGGVNLFKEIKSSIDVEDVANDTAKNFGISTKNILPHTAIKSKNRAAYIAPINVSYFINLVPLMPVSKHHVKNMPILAGLTTIKIASNTPPKNHPSQTTTRFDYLHNVVMSNGSIIQSWKGENDMRYVAILSLKGMN